MAKKEITNEDIMQMLGEFAESVDKRFELIDQKFDSLDLRLFRIENDITDIKSDIINLQASHDRLLNTVDKFITRIDHYETEQTMRDHEFQKLLSWARKVSKKTGIPLEDL